MCVCLQQELEKALSKVTMKFNDHHYQQVQEAYGILGKTQVHVHVQYRSDARYNERTFCVHVQTCLSLCATAFASAYRVCLLILTYWPNAFVFAHERIHLSSRAYFAVGHNAFA